MNNVITRVIHIRYFVFTIHSVGKMRVFTMCILTFFKIQLRIQEMNTNYKLAVLWVNLFSLVALFFIKWSWLVLSRNWRIFRRSNSSSSSAAFCSTFFFGGASLPVLPSKSSVVVASCLRSLLGYLSQRLRSLLCSAASMRRKGLRGNQEGWRSILIPLLLYRGWVRVISLKSTVSSMHENWGEGHCRE